MICEYAARRLVQTILRSTQNTGMQLLAAGGFASWQLEHKIHTEHKLDAMPRCYRDTTFNDGLPRNDLWIPKDIDVFFSGDPAVMIPIIEEAYRQFCGRIFGSAGSRTSHVTEHSDIYEWIDTHENGVELFGTVMTQADFPHSIVEEAIRSFSESTPALQEKLILQTWRMNCDYNMPFFPTELNIIQTLPSLSGYHSWVVQSFDLVHCCVSLSVAETGDWSFQHTNDAEECIKRRLLRFNTNNFTSFSSTRLIVRRLVKYYRNGFTFRGDDLFQLD